MQAILFTCRVGHIAVKMIISEHVQCNQCVNYLPDHQTSLLTYLEIDKYFIAMSKNACHSSNDIFL